MYFKDSILFQNITYHRAPALVISIIFGFIWLLFVLSLYTAKRIISGKSIINKKLNKLVSPTLSSPVNNYARLGTIPISQNNSPSDLQQRGIDSYEMVSKKEGDIGIEMEEVKPKKNINIVLLSLSWMCYLTFSGIPVTLSAFGIIPIWQSILMIFALFSYKLVQTLQLLAETLGSDAQAYSFYDKIKKGFIYGQRIYRRSLIALVSGIVFISLAAPLVTDKSCFNDHVERYGISISKYTYSSAFTRYLSLPKVCKDEAPCHVYTTLPFNTSSSVFINAHTNKEIGQITVNYDTVESYQIYGSLRYSQSSESPLSPNYDSTGERNIHSVLLTDLLADEMYVIEIYYNGKVQYTNYYQTLPNETSQKNLTLVYGGDAGSSATSKRMIDNIASKSPSAFIIGGDIAYDNGEASCYYSMDLFLWQIEKQLFNKVGKLIPMIMAVGNHDIGFTSLSSVTVPVDENGPSYFTNFPQNLPVDAQGKTINRVPTMAERSTYQAHMIGNILNVILDTAYMNSMNGDQLTWLNEISNTYKSNPKVAIYHDPIWPSCYPHFKSNNITAEGVKHWVPIFTQYNYMTGFENHAHGYKKTLPMNGTQVAQGKGGMRYFGDGALGPKITSCGANEDAVGIFDEYSGVNNFWLVNIDPKNNLITYDPIGLDNKPVGSTTVQNVNEYMDL